MVKPATQAHAGRALGWEEANFFRDELKVARALALKNQEDFDDLIFAFERLGSYLLGQQADLGRYSEPLALLASTSPLSEDAPGAYPNLHTPFKDLCNLVRKARNSAVHEGAFARHLTERAIEMALVLEDALMSNAVNGQLNQVRDFMARGVLCAEPWQPLSFVRQALLRNSFSQLPVWIDQKWHLVSDQTLTRYLTDANPPSRRERLMHTVEMLHRAQLLDQAVTVTPSESVQACIAHGKSLCLVVEPQHAERLLGVVTPFDLL